MAAVTYYPPPNGPTGPLEVRFDAMIFVVEPGVPKAIAQEDMAGVIAAIQASQGNMVSPQPTVTNQGTAGTTSYTYELVAVNANGDTLPGTVRTTTTGNATLNGTNYNQLTWAAPAGATSVKIIRTASAGTPSSTGIIGTVAASVTTFNDTGLAASAYTPAGAAVSQAAAVITDVEM